MMIRLVMVADVVVNGPIPKLWYYVKSIVFFQAVLRAGLSVIPIGTDEDLCTDKIGILSRRILGVEDLH